MNHHVAVKAAKVDIRRALAILELCPDLTLDEQLKLSTLEGETELNEIVSALLAENEDDEGMIEGVKKQIAERRERIERYERRIEARRNAIISLMDTAQITKLALPEATISLRTLQPAPKVADEGALPDEFCKFVRKADTAKIKEAFEAGKPLPAGVVLSNGGATISVRRK
jgi:hypothetical protein